MKVLILARTGSTRFPGKIMKSFGEGSLLEHIVNRIVDGGFELSEILLCTSNDASDEMLSEHGLSLGIDVYRGHLQNVSQRLLDATRSRELNEFIVVLGDNPWICPDQLRQLRNYSVAPSAKYVVSATPELNNLCADCVWPTGTRLQRISTNFMAECLYKSKNEDAKEHISFLFKDEVCSETSSIMFPARGCGFRFQDIQDLNISINTKEDYDIALDVLTKVGRRGTLRNVVNAYTKELL